MSKDKQQTAVGWLVKELNQKIDFIPLGKWDMIRDIIQQAKEMDKEQKINDFKHAQVLHAIGDETRAEQYYEQTYGVDNK
jgi:hypothetical protein